MVWREIKGEDGQMTIELAVCLPVILVVFVIVFDCLLFVSECAKFDHMAAQGILTYGTSSSADSLGTQAACSQVQEHLGDEFSKHGSSVEVSVSSEGWFDTYTCVFAFSPWPFSAASVAGVSSGIPVRLTHEYALAVDTYAPGDLG